MIPELSGRVAVAEVFRQVINRLNDFKLKGSITYTVVEDDNRNTFYIIHKYNGGEYKTDIYIDIDTENIESAADDFQNDLNTVIDTIEAIENPNKI
jgi:hypothetical protein